VAPLSCVSVNTKHMISVSGGYDYYVPSTTVASGGVASAPSATVSAWGRGADFSTAGDGFSSAVAVLGSSSSQDRSVDFVHSTNLVVSQARLLSTCTTRGWF
jgi:hypothetical protein